MACAGVALAEAGIPGPDGVIHACRKIDGGRVHFAGIDLPLPGGSPLAGEQRRVILGLRPEQISDPTNTEALGPDSHPLECLVEVTEPTGPDTLAVMMLGGVEATARLRADTNACAGEVSNFMVDMSKVCLFDPQSERRIG